MNLIVNRYLDRSQEQAIYELTLKKQRSKKSTISQKQVERMQQLASELMPQRKDLSELINELNTNIITSADAPTNSVAGRRHQIGANNGGQLNSRDTHDLCRCNSSATTNTNSSHTNDNETSTNELQRQSSTSTIATNSTSSSGSLQTSISSCCLQSSNCSTFASANIGLEQETSIKVNQMRLEHLNNELKRRLNQYEYLVAQEKAILGSNNKALFTNEGVNNFHLHQLA